MPYIENNNTYMFNVSHHLGYWKGYKELRLSTISGLDVTKTEISFESDLQAFIEAFNTGVICSQCLGDFITNWAGFDVLGAVVLPGYNEEEVTENFYIERINFMENFMEMLYKDLVMFIPNYQDNEEGIFITNLSDKNIIYILDARRQTYVPTELYRYTTHVPINTP